jgi:hypothetical protein
MEHGYIKVTTTLNSSIWWPMVEKEKAPLSPSQKMIIELREMKIY